jgi:hypothetical protein
VRHAVASPRRFLAAHAALLVFAGWCWWMGLRMAGAWMEGGDGGRHGSNDNGRPLQSQRAFHLAMDYLEAIVYTICVQ